MLTRPTELSTTKLSQPFCVLFLLEKVKLTTFWELKSSPSRQNCIKFVIDFYALVQVLVEVLNKDKKMQEAYENYV